LPADAYRCREIRTRRDDVGQRRGMLCLRGMHRERREHVEFLDRVGRAEVGAGADRFHRLGELDQPRLVARHVNAARELLPDGDSDRVGPDRLRFLAAK